MGLELAILQIQGTTIVYGQIGAHPILTSFESFIHFLTRSNTAMRVQMRWA
jgi:hypothetical protein